MKVINYSGFALPVIKSPNIIHTEELAKEQDHADEVDPVAAKVGEQVHIGEIIGKQDALAGVEVIEHKMLPTLVENMIGYTEQLLEIGLILVTAQEENNHVEALEALNEHIIGSHNTEEESVTEIKHVPPNIMENLKEVMNDSEHFTFCTFSETKNYIFLNLLLSLWTSQFDERLHLNGLYGGPWKP